MELVLAMYNAHPYFPLKNLGKQCTLSMAKYSSWEPHYEGSSIPF